MIASFYFNVYVSNKCPIMYTLFIEEIFNDYPLIEHS